MVKGQRVVCINDVFSPTVRALYKQLPVKDTIYTVREVFLGREKIVKGGDTATVGLLLEELVNPKDPFHQGEQELGFTSERFAPLNELPDEKKEVEETVAIGAWAPACASRSCASLSSLTTGPAAKKTSHAATTGVARELTAKVLCAPQS